MESGASAEVAQSAEFEPVSAEERIQDLNQLDQEIVLMLKAMGRAIQVMSADENEPMSLANRRDIFKENVAEALSRLAVVDVRQRRSIAALTEAEIIPKTAPSNQRAALGPLGNLDVSQLNSQNDKVGKEIEAEQWVKVREILEKLQGADISAAGGEVSGPMAL